MNKAVTIYVCPECGLKKLDTGQHSVQFLCRPKTLNQHGNGETQYRAVKMEPVQYVPVAQEESE